MIGGGSDADPTGSVPPRSRVKKGRFKERSKEPDEKVREGRICILCYVPHSYREEFQNVITDVCHFCFDCQMSQMLTSLDQFLHEVEPHVDRMGLEGEHGISLMDLMTIFNRVSVYLMSH